MKVLNSAQNFDEIELINMLLLIFKDASSLSESMFYKKYASFEIPEQLFQFKFKSLHEGTALHLVMQQFSEARDSSHRQNLIAFFEFLINNGADINIKESGQEFVEKTPLFYLVTSELIVNQWHWDQIFSKVNQAKVPIKNNTLNLLITQMLVNKYWPDLKKRDLIDRLILMGGEITRDHELICKNDQFFQENQSRWKCEVLARSHEQLKEKYELTIRRLEQQNNLLTEQLSQLSQKIDSLINSSEKIETNPEASKASLSFFL